jgi:hypothetical protein
MVAKSVLATGTNNASVTAGAATITTPNRLGRKKKVNHKELKLLHRKRVIRKEVRKVDIDFWTEAEDQRLKDTYPNLTADELLKVFPNRTPSAVHSRANLLDLHKKEEIISIKQGMNASKIGLTNFADYPVEALRRKHPDLAQAYDELLASLLKHPSVDVSNVLQVEMIKEAVLSKVTQYIMMGDRIESGCKGKTLVFNPKTGFEQWVESRYLHGPDIMNDAKLARTILKDLGILEERERKVEVIGNLKMLWERDRDSDDTDTRDRRPKVINAEAKRIN